MAAKKTSIREADPSSKVQPPSKARSNSRAKPKTKSRTTSGAKTAASAMPKSAPANGVKSAKKEGKSPAHRSAPRPAQRDVPTEQLILDAARQVFHRSGMDGARMQEIAEEAGLNQALLHYYFRNKENLFSAVFEEDFSQMLDRQARQLQEGQTLFDLIRAFVRGQIEFVQQHPYLPHFILQELKRCPDHVHHHVHGYSKKGIQKAIQELIAKAVQDGEIRPISPVDLMSNMIALCTHPFLAKPLIMMSHGMTEKQFNQFIEDRKTSVAEFLIHGLKPLDSLNHCDGPAVYEERASAGMPDPVKALVKRSGRKKPKA